MRGQGRIGGRMGGWWAILFAGVALAGLLPRAAEGASMVVSTQPVGNTIKGRMLDVQPAVTVLLEDGRPDVSNSGVVVASLGVNPTAASLNGRTEAQLFNGVATFTDLAVYPGGQDFKMTFTAMGGGVTPEPLEAMSDAFFVAGQEARLKIITQPRITLDADRRGAVAPVVGVVDEVGEELPMANPMVTVSVTRNPNAGSFTPPSVLSVAAEGGRAEFGSLWLTRAATANEPGATTETGARGYDQVYTLSFAAAGFAPVESQEFDVSPLVQVSQQPSSDRVVTVPPVWCEGGADGCTGVIANYLGAGHVVRNAMLDVDVSCTDLDSPEEMVRHISIGGMGTIPRGMYDGGPWEGCAFAGCRDECDTNTRSVLKGFDVSGAVGEMNERTGIYRADGRPLTVQMALNTSSNICPCGGNQLRARLSLKLTVSEAVQGAALWVQPKVSVSNGDGSLYAQPTTVVASMSEESNPAASELEGTVEALSVDGVASFTDLAVMQGGEGFRLSFHLKYTPLQRNTSSGPFGVGWGNFPQLTLDCDTCVKPRITTGENNKLQPSPRLQLQANLSNVVGAARSFIEVDVRMGVNELGGAIEGVTLVAASLGKVTFDGLKIFNGNCADQPAVCGGTCGSGYTLIFTVNGNSVETTPFSVNGNNRSPEWLPPSIEHNTLIEATVGIRTPSFSLKAADANYDPVTIVQSSSFEGVNITASQWSNPNPSVNPTCPRPITSNLDMSVGADAIVDLTLTCRALPAVFPTSDDIVDVCFEAIDTTLMVNSLSTRTTASAPRCVRVKLETATRPVFVAPYFKDGRAPLPEGGMMAESLARRVHAQAGCLLELPVTVQEMGVDAMGGMLDSRLQVMPLHTTVTTVYEQYPIPSPLPPGAELRVTNASRGNNTAVLAWRPMRGDDGHVFTVCLSVRSVFDGGACEQRLYATAELGQAGEYCIDVEVERCRYCPGPGEGGLMEIAKVWHTSFLALWAGNAMRPDDVADGVSIDMGIRFGAGNSDTLEGLAVRFGVREEWLLEWNPDLGTDAAAERGRELLSSEGVYESGEAPWVWARGVRMPDSQEICVLPDICTGKAALPPVIGVDRAEQGNASLGAVAGEAEEEEASAELEPYNCDQCDPAEDLYCGGPVCLEGQGAPPWSDDRCSLFGTSRCERCRMCREEIVDADGRILTLGQYRAGGCFREADSDCRDCTLCGAGEFEVEPCTPLSNRKCAPVGSQQGGSLLPV